MQAQPMHRLRRKLGRSSAFLAMAAASGAFLVPFYVMVSMSLKSPGELAATSVWDWPKSPSFDNYREVLTNPSVSFRLLLSNTALVAGLQTIGTLLSCSAIAYGFARIRFRGRDRLCAILLATMMLPGIVTMIPTYVFYKYLGWIDTFLPLTVPAFFGSAFNVFLLRQFFMGIPRELDEAALLDGASHLTILLRILLPLSGPALATVGLFSFIGGWRDFMGPLLYLNDPDKQTLEVGLRTFQTQHNEQWHLLMAGAVLVVLPLIVVFFLGQRFFVRGIAMTGLK